MLEEASGARKAHRDIRRLAPFLTTDQDRSLAAALPTFLYGLIAWRENWTRGVHVVTTDDQHARSDADLYRTINDELRFGKVVLIYANQFPEARQAAHRATITVGAGELFRLDEASAEMAIIRVAGAWSNRVSRFPRLTCLPNPT